MYATGSEIIENNHVAFHTALTFADGVCVSHPVFSSIPCVPILSPAFFLFLCYFGAVQAIASFTHYSYSCFFVLFIRHLSQLLLPTTVAHFPLRKGNPNHRINYRTNTHPTARYMLRCQISFFPNTFSLLCQSGALFINMLIFPSWYICFIYREGERTELEKITLLSAFCKKRTCFGVLFTPKNNETPFEAYKVFSFHNINFRRLLKMKLQCDTLKIGVVKLNLSCCLSYRARPRHVYPRGTS